MRGWAPLCYLLDIRHLPTSLLCRQVGPSLLLTRHKASSHQSALQTGGPLLMSMMEKSHTRECHCDPELVAAVDNKVISYRAARFCYIADSARCRPLDIVIEREESV